MKKTICLIITISIICLTVSANELLTDKTIKDLYDFGIMQGDENGDLRLKDNISRAEFCKMVCVALGFKNISSNQLFVVEDFYDVNPEHWAYGYIQTAKGLSLIDGVGKGYFNPNGNIKICDAVKILISALGYETKTEKISYPQGYLTIAEDISLIKKEEFQAEKYAIREEIAYLISTALDIPILRQTSFGSIINYEAMDGKDGRPLITLRINLMPDGE